ncbi:hypothetical protein AB0D12_19975 [Streptomyces sp. NPDC048479]
MAERPPSRLELLRFFLERVVGVDHAVAVQGRIRRGDPPARR